MEDQEQPNRILSLPLHRRSLRVRLRLWTIAAFVTILAFFTALDIWSERREMRRADTSQANVLLSHLAGMPEFRDSSAIAGAHVSTLREGLRPGGADLELRAYPQAPASPGPGKSQRAVLASRSVNLRDGVFELRYTVEPDRYSEAIRRSIGIHAMHALFALAVLIGGFEWILRRHLVHPLRAIAYQIHQMRRGGWAPTLPTTDEELQGLEHAVAGLGPVLEGQVHRWIDAERRVATAEVLRSLCRSIQEPRRRVQAIASDLQAQHLVAPQAARKLRGMLDDLDRITRALDLEDWHRLGPASGAASDARAAAALTVSLSEGGAR